MTFIAFTSKILGIILFGFAFEKWDLCQRYNKTFSTLFVTFSGTIKKNPKKIDKMNAAVILIVCVVMMECKALDTGTVTPLNPDNNAVADKMGEKDLKKLDRFTDVPPEYYK